MSVNLRLLLFFFSFIFFTSASSLHSQTLFYDIYKGDDPIGEIVVEKVTRGNKVHYEANSEAKFRILWMNELTTSTAADFINNELSYAASKITLNEKVREHATTKKDGAFYRYYNHPDKHVKKEHPPIVNSTVALYYAEPVGVKQVFSENYQQLCKLKVIGANAYELTLPNGKVNQYFYKNGQLIEVKVFRTFVDLSFKLKNRG